MAKRSKVDTLPAALKAWLDAEMIKRGFGDYVQLAADLQAKGADVSKSALHRYGSKYELRVSQLKSSVEMATALVDAAPDDEDKLGGAVIRMVQEKILGLLIETDIDPAKVDINKLFKNAAEISKASTSQKKNQVEMRERVKKAAADVVNTARKAGMSDETIDVIRARILGVNDDPPKGAA